MYSLLGTSLKYGVLIMFKMAIGFTVAAIVLSWLLYCMLEYPK